MPIYDYRCDSCGDVLERLAGFEDETLPCPKCGGVARRMPNVSPPAIHFKAPGFYSTDHRVLDENREG